MRSIVYRRSFVRIGLVRYQYERPPLRTFAPCTRRVRVLRGFVVGRAGSARDVHSRVAARAGLRICREACTQVHARLAAASRSVFDGLRSAHDVPARSPPAHGKVRTRPCQRHFRPPPLSPVCSPLTHSALQRGGDRQGNISCECEAPTRQCIGAAPRCAHTSSRPSARHARPRFSSRCRQTPRSLPATRELAASDSHEQKKTHASAQSSADVVDARVHRQRPRSRPPNALSPPAHALKTHVPRAKPASGIRRVA
ncbi:hypothetical protein HETIRDRAFT_147567, partial [Heterobasidion irregulare TC 32-1]